MKLRKKGRAWGEVEQVSAGADGVGQGGGAEMGTDRSESELAGVFIPGLADGTFSRARGSRFHNRRAGRQQAARFA